MVDVARFEGEEIALGTPVTLLVSRKVGPFVCIPLHSLPDRPASDLLFHFLGHTPTAQTLWDQITSSDPFGEGVRPIRHLAYVVGEKALWSMREALDVPYGHPWPEGIEVLHLHG